MEEENKTEPVKKRRGRPRLSDEHKRQTRLGCNKRYYEKMKKARTLMKEIEKQIKT